MIEGVRASEIGTAGSVVLTALLLAACADKSDLPRQIAGADPKQGFATAREVGCFACHAAPGMSWPRGGAGPTLDGFGSRPLIAGRLPNQPDVLTVWLVDAPSLAPATGMPPMPLSDAEARDIAAWLYTLE